MTEDLLRSDINSITKNEILIVPGTESIKEERSQAESDPTNNRSPRKGQNPEKLKITIKADRIARDIQASSEKPTSRSRARVSVGSREHSEEYMYNTPINSSQRKARKFEVQGIERNYRDDYDLSSGFMKYEKQENSPQFQSIDKFSEFPKSGLSAASCSAHTPRKPSVSPNRRQERAEPSEKPTSKRMTQKGSFGVFDSRRLSNGSYGYQKPEELPKTPNTRQKPLMRDGKTKGPYESTNTKNFAFCNSGLSSVKNSVHFSLVNSKVGTEPANLYSSYHQSQIFEMRRSSLKQTVYRAETAHSQNQSSANNENTYSNTSTINFMSFKKSRDSEEQQQARLETFDNNLKNLRRDFRSKEIELRQNREKTTKFKYDVENLKKRASNLIMKLEVEKRKFDRTEEQVKRVKEEIGAVQKRMNLGANGAAFPVIQHQSQMNYDTRATGIRNSEVVGAESSAYFSVKNRSILCSNSHTEHLNRHSVLQNKMSTYYNTPEIKSGLFASVTNFNYLTDSGGTNCFSVYKNKADLSGLKPRVGGGNRGKEVEVNSGRLLKENSNQA